MDESRIIQCSCGQESQLVLLDGQWHYDVTRHGNGEPCEGRCFNCRAPLIDDELFGVETADEPVTTGTAAAEDGPQEISMSMKRAELVEIAVNLGIEIPTGATKAVILESIEKAQADQGQEPEDE